MDTDSVVGEPKPRKKTERRVAWAGLTEKESQRDGARLLAALFRQANEDGISLRALGVKTGVTYGYIHQLKIGTRAIPQVSDDFITHCARYLKRPKQYVRELAGQATFEDEFREDELDGELDTAFSVMQRDSKWGGNLPLSFKSLDRKERLYLVKLYEAATNKRLLPEIAPDLA